MERRNYDRMRYTAHINYQDESQYRKRARRVQVKLKERERRMMER